MVSASVVDRDAKNEATGASVPRSLVSCVALCTS
jgi:hypothetical protein